MTTDNKDHVFLTQYTEGHELVDSLPYVDDFNDTLKKQISILIEQEMKTFEPQDYLANLGEAAEFELRGTELTKKEFERLAKGKPMQKLDQSHYEIPKSLPKTKDPKKLKELTDRLDLITQYNLSAGDNLELTNRFGAKKWRNQLEELERLLEHERTTLKSLQQETTAVNAARKRTQEKVGEKLYMAEHDYFSLAQKNVDIGRACNALQAEIDELVAFNEAENKK